tara:strand:+ start:520 stop:1353 length:834 start_codon:yes stop_codon:yes gene_type:complete
MAKDPAFLFYPNDWIGGTMGMTFEEKGAYMELLMMQFNRGHMTKHMMGHTVGLILPKILDKFEIDEDGLYFNKRLEEEKDKRKSFVVSRLKNKNGTNQHTKKVGHVTSHMTSHMEDVNIIDYNTLTNYYKSHIIKFLIDDLKENKEITSIDEIKNLEMIVVEMNNIWTKAKPDYCFDKLSDYSALLRIAYLIAEKKGIRKYDAVHLKQTEITTSFQNIVNFISKTDNKFFKKLTLSGICIRKNFQSIEEEMRNLLIPEKNEVLEGKRVHQEDYFENQ